MTSTASKCLRASGLGVMLDAKCKTVTVPSDACYVCFGPKKAKYRYSEDYWHTARGEVMIVDFDKDSKVIGIELVGLSKATHKPCQGGPRRHK